MTNFILSSLIEIDSWVLYLIMAILLLGNIAFIVLFILSVSRNNILEGRIEEILKNSLSNKTQHDLKTSQPVGARGEDIDGNNYKIVPAKDKMGWYVKKDGDLTPVSFVETREEAEEVVKDITRKS